MALIRSACSCCVPCEKFRRKTFTPACMRSRSRSGVPLAVPTVATIFVARCSGDDVIGGVSFTYGGGADSAAVVR